MKKIAIIGGMLMLLSAAAQADDCDNTNEGLAAPDRGVTINTIGNVVIASDAEELETLVSEYYNNQHSNMMWIDNVDFRKYADNTVAQ